MFPDTPSQRVQFLLGTEDDDEEHIPHDLFTEMDEICLRDGEDSDWRESARYCPTLTSLTWHLHTVMTYTSLPKALIEWSGDPTYTDERCRLGSGVCLPVSLNNCNAFVLARGINSVLLLVFSDSCQC